MGGGTNSRAAMEWSCPVRVGFLLFFVLVLFANMTVKRGYIRQTALFFCVRGRSLRLRAYICRSLGSGRVRSVQVKSRAIDGCVCGYE